MIKEQSQTWAKIQARMGAFFSRFPISPNTYTWVSVLPTFVGFFAIIYGYVFTGVLFFLLSGMMDLIDGSVARHTGKVSRYGAFLDGSLDRIVDFFVIFSYLWLPIKMPDWGLDLGAWVAIALYFAILPSFEVAYANHRQAVDDPHERIIWRILNRGEMYVFMLLIPTISIFSSIWAGYILVTLIVLSIITTLQAFFLTLYHARKLGR